MTGDILLVAAVSIDAFIAAFAYGADSIRIPFLSAAIISGIGTAVLGASMVVSSAAGEIIPSGLCRWLGLIILLIIGLAEFFQNMLKSALRKRSRRNMKFSISGIGFVISVFADETKADADSSKMLSPKEAAALAAALSADSVGCGLGAGLGGGDIGLVTAMSFVAGLISVAAGSTAGTATGKRCPGISWVSGILLIILGIVNFIK